MRYRVFYWIGVFLVIGMLFCVPISASAAQKVNINSATVEQLEALPHIGPKTAVRIVEYRKSHGRFNSVDELLVIKGIGEKRLQKIRTLISID